MRFSTYELNEAHRSSRWEEWNKSALIGLSCQTPHGRGLRGEEITLDLPDVTIGRVRAEPHRVERSVQTVDDSPANSLVVYAVLQGRTTFSDGNRRQLVAPGDLAIIDADRPFERTFPTRFAELALKFPRHRIDGCNAEARPGGAEFVRASGLTALRVHALGRHIADSISSVPPIQPETINRVAIDLVTNLTTREALGDRLALGQLLIEQNLSDPLLSASRLAAALEVSQRQLSRLFGDAQTSFPRYVTARRLVRATALLNRPAALPVGKIAAQCGFSSATYFNRVFRDHHGVPPGRFRRA